MSIVSETRSVCHLSGENNKSFIISTTWRETKFSITIFSGTDTFTGDMAEEKTKEFSNQLGISIENYISECKKALTINGGCDNFIYKIDTIKNVFQWKKVSFDMKIIFGSIELTAVPVVETLNDILNVTVCDNGQLKERVTQLTEERNLLKEDNKELLLRIDECMNLKNEMEIQLYNQFLTILNTKKRKICKLEKQLTSKRHKAGGVSEDDNDEDVDDVEPVGNPNKNVNVNKRNELYDCDTEVESEADSENELPENISRSLDSDPEMNPTYSIPKRNKRNTKDINEATNSTKETNVFKPRNCKRLSDGSDKYDNLNNEPGPSGTKISKTTEDKYSLKNKNSPENDSSCVSIADTVIVPFGNDHAKNIQENVVDSLSTANTLLLPSQNNFCNEATKSDCKEWSKIKDKPNELNNITKGKVTSSVDDILTRLIG